MPDITMCNDHECPKRHGCHRYTARPDPLRQSYFTQSPRDGRDDCRQYWPNATVRKPCPMPTTGN